MTRPFTDTFRHRLPKTDLTDSFLIQQITAVRARDSPIVKEALRAGAPRDPCRIGMGSRQLGST